MTFLSYSCTTAPAYVRMHTPCNSRNNKQSTTASEYFWIWQQQIGCLAWDCPFAAGAALKKTKGKKNCYLFAKCQYQRDKPLSHMFTDLHKDFSNGEVACDGLTLPPNTSETFKIYSKIINWPHWRATRKGTEIIGNFIFKLKP